MLYGDMVTYVQQSVPLVSMRVLLGGARLQCCNSAYVAHSLLVGQIRRCAVLCCPIVTAWLIDDGGSHLEPSIFFVRHLLYSKVPDVV